MMFMSTDVPTLPQDFIKYVILDRVDSLKRLISGDRTGTLLSFTRANPVVVTDGPAGLSGSVKMVGFIPKPEFLGEMLERARDLPKLSTDGVLKALLNYFYDVKRLDLMKLGALEMAFKHTWINVKSTGKATLVFFTPPITSYEVRCSVVIHEEGPIKEYLNLLHDAYHGRGLGNRPVEGYPAYEFIIEEIYDQSASSSGFGRLIFKAH